MVPAILVVLSGCAAPMTAPHWPHGLPAPVLVSNALDRCRVAAVHAAAEWFRVYVGVQVFAVRVVRWDLQVPPRGAIVVLPDSAAGTSAHAQLHIGGDQIHSVTVRLGECSVRAAAHELGHAVGMLHSHKQGDLMYIRNLESAWGLDVAAMDVLLSGR